LLIDSRRLERINKIKANKLERFPEKSEKYSEKSDSNNNIPERVKVYS